MSNPDEANEPELHKPELHKPELDERELDERSDLVLSRIHHYRDTIRGYQVQINGEFVGRVKDSQEETFTLRPGTYTVRLRLLWIFSPKVEVTLRSGGETRLVCGPNGGILQAWRLFLAPLTAIFLRPADSTATSNSLSPGLK